MAFWKRRAAPQGKLRELIGDYELPSFSAAAVATLGLLRDDADMTRIAERIMADPGLSVRILRTVNSASFGLRQEVTNLAHAVSLLGRSRVEALVLAAAVGKALPVCHVIDIAGFWRTSAQRACLARKIAASLDPPLEMEAFTAGLLQDMAVPVLATANPGQYANVYQRSETDVSCTLRDLEEEAFGFDHAEVGAMMAETWDLPETLITAIADHHLLGQRAPGAVEAVALIRHSEPPDELQALRAHCGTQLQLTPDALDVMIEAAGAEASSLAESMTPRTAASDAVAR